MKFSRSLYQKLLGLFHLIPPSPGGFSGDCTKPRNTILLQNGLVPEDRRLLPESPPGSQKQELSPHGATPGRLLSREELESRVVELWTDVWLGLYQVHNVRGPRHHDRIKALCHGAGLISRSQIDLPELKDLKCHFWRYGENRGVAGLKLYEHLSVSTLESVIELLEAYEREIPNLGRLYKALRECQLGIGDCTVRGSTSSRYMSIAEPLNKALSLLDSRMDVLVMDIYDEAMALHVDRPELQKGRYVYHIAFPETA